MATVQDTEKNIAATRELLPHILGTANDERWIMTLATVPDSSSDSSVRVDEVISSLREAGAYSDVPEPTNKYMWVKLRDATLSHSIERTADGYRRTQLGDLGLAVGGQVLKLTAETNVRPRQLIGETPSLSGYRDNVSTLLGIWAHMLCRGPNTRVPLTALAQELTTYGLTEDGVAMQLRELAKQGMISRHHDRTAMRGKQLTYRLADGPGGAPKPRTAASRYLEVVRNICVLDPTTIETGIDEAERRLRTPSLVGMYFLRGAQASS